MNTLVLISCMVATALADIYHEASEEHKVYDEPAHYSYLYKVHDSHTGDMKSHHETRDGDTVKGYYTLKEADGSVREVHYTADKHSGFQAIVKSSGHPHLVQPQHMVLPVHTPQAHQSVQHDGPHYTPISYSTSAIHPHGHSHQAVRFY